MVQFLKHPAIQELCAKHAFEQTTTTLQTSMEGKKDKLIKDQSVRMRKTMQLIVQRDLEDEEDGLERIYFLKVFMVFLSDSDILKNLKFL